MGTSCGRATSQAEEKVLSFNEVEEIEIKEYNVSGAIDDIVHLIITLTSPTTFLSQTATISSRRCDVTACVLPGLDPHGVYVKECQDGVLTIQSTAGFLAVLMDGHGIEGQKIVNSALSLISREFPLRASSFEVFSTQADPESAISDLLQMTDQHVKEDPGIDSSISGSTAIMIYGNAKGLHVGSVGDSRAILGVNSSKEPASEGKKNENKHFRKVKAGKVVDAVQLTVDQKPNHVGEMDRIQKAGGRVAKITDEYGRAVGPYRVWERFGTLPGLAMSRSIGDKMGSSIGVISTPIFNFFPYYSSQDLFIVVASDGVW